MSELTESVPASTSDLGRGRVGSLDGVRGLAALVVVVHHILLATSPVLASGYSGSTFKRGSVAWWAFNTPIHLFWAGPEAVVVFFVLSGFVLALPALRQPGWFNVSYYPKRLIRLYLPVWGAIVLAILWRELQPRTPTRGASWWLNAHAVPMTVHAGLVQASLRDQGGWIFDPVLWSLHWEVLYSVLLPMAMVVPVLTRRRPRLAAAFGLAAFVAVTVGRAKRIPQAEYLPMFVMGALLAFHSLRVAAWVRQANLWIVRLGALVVVFMLTADYWVRPGWSRDRTVQNYLAGGSIAVVTVGALGLLMLAIGRPAVRRTLERRPVRWLGSRSYSLYLVHEPIVVTLAFALGGRPVTLLLLPIALPSALIAAEAFWRLVERPSIALAHEAGRQVQRLTIGVRAW